jgi:hypothetical protein
MESLFLLAFSDEKFLAALAMASSEAFFNKLLVALPDKAIYPLTGPRAEGCSEISRGGHRCT